MKTKVGNYFPRSYFFLIFWCLPFLFSCNGNPDLPNLDGNLSLKDVVKSSSIVEGTSSEIELQIENLGLQSVSIDQFEITQGMNYFSLTGGTCGSDLLDLAAGQSCNYLLEFTPPTQGDYTLGFSLGYGSNSGVLKQLTASLQFQVVAPPPAPLPPAPIFAKGELKYQTAPNFGQVTVNAKQEKILTLTNIGSEKVRIDEFWFEGNANLFSVTGGTCGSGGLSLAANTSCTYAITFSPNAAGAFSQTMVVGYYPGDTWNWTGLNVALSAEAISSPAPAPAPAPVPTPVPVPVPQPVPAPIPGEVTGRLHVEGRFIKDDVGNVVVLKGVNIADPEHLNLKPWERPNISAMSVTQDAVENFHAKVIRLPIHPGAAGYPQEGWFGSNGGAKYFNDHIKPLVDYLTALKIYTIIDLHYVDNWSGKMPKVAEFWNFMAPKFKDNPYVIYEIFNEPIYPDNWDQWKSEIAQPAVDLIRGHAPDNLIIVGGPLWSAHMAGALNNPVSGKNIVYTAHIYSNQWPNNVSKNFGQAIEQLPFFVTEWGFETGGTEGGSRSKYGVPFEQWMKDHQFSWTVWCFDTRWGPRMFDSNWNLLTGDGGMGTFVRDLLLENQLSNY